MMTEPVTPEQAAAELGYNIKHVYRLLRTGVMRGEKKYRVWLIDPTEVRRIKLLQGRGGRLPKRPKPGGVSG